MRIILKLISLVTLNLLSCISLSGQDFNNIRAIDFNSNVLRDNIRVYNQQIVDNQSIGWGFTLGAHIELSKIDPSIRLFSAIAVVANISTADFEVLPSLQSELELFKGGLGNSILKTEKRKFSIEWRNILQLTFGGKFDNNGAIYGRPLSPTIGQSYSTLYDPLDISGSIGTSIVTGINHDRHQQLGFFKLGLFPIDIFYFNDGPPFDILALGDTYDRFWTGVGALGLYYIGESAITSFEIRYARYTGDDPFVYETASDLGLNYLLYKNPKEQFYNKGRFQYRLGLFGNTNVGYSIYQPKWTDVQDLIHYGWIPLHSTPTKRYFGGFTDYHLRTINLIN